MGFWPAFVLFAVSLAVLAVLYGAASIGRIARQPLRQQPFLSGLPVQEHAVSRFHVRWYTIALVFLIFDMEMVFMYPWVLAIRQVGVSAVVEMFTFLAVLVVAVLYSWREGAFRWS